MTQIKSFTVGAQTPATFGDGRLTIIAGPCVVESLEHAVFMAGELQNITQKIGFDFVYKSSFDKANRSSSSSFRGNGMDFGLEILSAVKERFGVPIVTDVHETWQVAPVAEIADMLQIPAFLCRQTDLLEACARTNRAVNVKKGQFLAPADAQNIVAKLQSAGAEKILLTERGASFGYNNLVVDFRAFPVMRGFGVPVVYDVTHSLQVPGGLGTSTGGQPEFIEPMARAAVAVGIDALFCEVHENPQAAPSDGANMLPLNRFEALLIKLKAIHDLNL